MIGILLAAGRGTRMKSETPKVLFDVNDQPLCFQPFRTLFELCDKVVVVVGYRGEVVKEAILLRARELFTPEQIQTKIVFVTQQEQRGTGYAVRTALGALGKSLRSETEVVILNGDLPLIRLATLQKLVKYARTEKLNSACLSARVRDPKGLGRIVRDDRGVFTVIREEKDANVDERKIREINGGVYYFQANLLAEAIDGLKSDNAQNELYLTDLLGNSKGHAFRSEAVCLRQSWDLLGVNTTYELASVRFIAQARLQRRLCEDFGLDLLDPATAFISERASFGNGVRLGPSTVIKGPSRLGNGVSVEGSSVIENSSIEENTKVPWGCVIRDSKIGRHASVGPWSHLRPESILEDDVKIGNFVELKKTRMHKGSKASHLSYLGDADVGEEANIGCGTITCNFDGFNKHQTKIGKKAFIGSDTQLVAPVSVGDNAYVAAGTTLVQDVPAGALALGRPQLVIKEGYAEKLNQRRKKTLQK